jgi:hypothetical protein
MITAKDMGDALNAVCPNATWVLNEPFQYANLRWLDESKIKPTEAEVMAEVVRIQAQYKATEYQRNRASEYPSIQEQLDMQYWDSVNGTTVWQDTINAIKAKYPKVG